MRVLIVGSGGREHALAWKLSLSPRVSQLYVAPGNGGTAAGCENVAISASDISALVSFTHERHIDLTVVGPEAPLVAGLVDAFAAEGLRAFGPAAAAAQLEGSKVFAKRFMIEEGIPTAVAAIFDDYDLALGYLRTQEPPVVVKASGLAAGKGVTVCQTIPAAEAALHRAMVERIFGTAGDQVLIEDCLGGEEVSMLGFCDGRTVVPMLPARDYKRANDADQGPNTGGMGGYAPSPYVPPDVVAQIVSRVLQPAVDGMARRGTPYVGVLYAGLMLTDQGPRVLEFNCRFGDPETQVLLPLLETDLLEVVLACLDGRLGELDVHWSSEHTVSIVMASGGYPDSYEVGKPIHGVEAANSVPGVVVFQAGTARRDGELLTAGGRVLAATAKATTLEAAREQAYRAVAGIDFTGAHYRRDIGAGAPASGPVDATVAGAYARAGVDIEAKNRAFARMRQRVESTYTPAVLAGIGSFGGLYALEHLQQARQPVLVASTDGVGTKTMIAAQMGRYDTIGCDIVNHCVNDVLVQGARPLFFLDYIAAGKLDPDMVVAIVQSCADACRANGCALIGGETAEMPGIYQPGTFDLVGTLIGWVAREQVIDGHSVRPGTVCIGLPSSGLHTNGYSLVRRIFATDSWETVPPELGRPLGEALLTPHRSYLPAFEKLAEAGVGVLAMAHITGGGFPDNLPRVLPPGIGVRIDRTAWQVPPIFRLIQTRGQVDADEMYRVFNMGIGMVLLVEPEQVALAMDALENEGVVIGEALPWDGAGPRVQL
jgi:phosphoribosylamine--glycine ligase/phosphoribosylformylglycinamidine cyclo-ligase